MSEEEIRLDQTKRVFDTLAELISKNETCTYRYLIYDLLGFDGCYATLISGLTITNALVEKEDLQQKVEQLEERCAYLERSNNRREDEIIELRNENVDLVSKNNQLENIIDVKKYDYDYLKTLFSKSSKEEVLKAYTYKCEQLEKVIEARNEFEMKSMKLENIRKEAIEYLKEFGFYGYNKNWQDLLNILNKGSE